MNIWEVLEGESLVAQKEICMYLRYEDEVASVHRLINTQSAAAGMPVVGTDNPRTSDTTDMVCDFCRQPIPMTKRQEDAVVETWMSANGGCRGKYLAFHRRDILKP